MSTVQASRLRPRRDPEQETGPRVLSALVKALTPEKVAELRAALGDVLDVAEASSLPRTEQKEVA